MVSPRLRQFSQICVSFGKGRLHLGHICACSGAMGGNPSLSLDNCLAADASWDERAAVALISSTTFPLYKALMAPASTNSS